MLRRSFRKVADRLRSRMAQDKSPEKELWINKLRSSGVKAAHPDDGWVNREYDFVSLCYPAFNDGLKAGDLVALGDQSSYRLVRILSCERTKLGIDRWFFEET